MNECVATGIDTAHELQELQTLSRDLLAKAKAKGASSVEVAASVSGGFSLNVRMGDVETVEYHHDKSMGLTVYFGQRKGSASTSDMRAQSIAQTVDAACAIAKMTSEDPCNGLADKALMAWDYADHPLDVYHPWQLTPEQGIELALACEAKARKGDARISNSEGVSISTGESARVYANSHDFVGAVASSRHSISCSLLAKQAESMQRDYYYSVGRSATDLCTWDELAKRAVERTVRRLGATSIATCQVPVIFEASIASGLLRSFRAAISGGNLYRKSSFLLDQLDKPVFAPHIHIHQRPHLSTGLSSALFDGEGVQTADRDFVQQGVLTSYVLGSYSARKLGMQTTGNAGGVFNLSIDGGDDDLSALLKKMDKGLLVTELMGQGVNIVTGDYSRGASGFWVENGEIQYPVEQITIAGNLCDMFKQLLAVGNDIDKRGGIYTGSLLIEQMTIAGQ